MKIFLGDLVHTWGKVSVWTMPLNIGFVATYARQHLSSEIEFRLFKRPELMIDAIKNEKPDVVGLSHYVWNANLNRLVFDVARRNCPEALLLGGGPIFTSLNATETGARKFFSAVPACDAFVVNQGEQGFVELIKRFSALGHDVARLRAERVRGCLTNDLAENNAVHVGETIDPLRELDRIPSPYLAGLLDSFFDEPIIPIIETNRSCPYRCTFCAWGIGTGKLATFSDERVLAEIDYIAARCRKTANMYVADANFGILDRDASFARRMYERHLSNGYPGHVMVQWNKSRPDRVLRVAKEFRNISEVGASMQSLSPEVLAAIKRRNLPLEAIANMRDELQKDGVSSQMFSELILGLPNETRQGHIDSNKRLIDLGAEVFNYNLHLLPGTEMDGDSNRQAYFRRTGWRLHDNAYGIYDGQKVFEGQEVVLETSTMTTQELRGFRFIHFLLQFMWGRKWYYDFLMLFKTRGLHPVDFVDALAARFESDRGEMGALYRDFRRDHDLENFESYEALVSYWSQEETFERLRSGSYGKLNYMYTYKILLEHHDTFNRFLYDFASATVDRVAPDDPGEFLEQCAEVLRFVEFLRVSLTDDLQISQNRRAGFNFDILAWRLGHNRGVLPKAAGGRRFEYEFFLTDQQRGLLDRQLKQFNTGNLNQALRKMSEDTSPDQFFYQVREVNNPSYIR